MGTTICTYIRYIIQCLGNSIMPSKSKQSCCHSTTSLELSGLGNVCPSHYLLIQDEPKHTVTFKMNSVPRI